MLPALESVFELLVELLVFDDAVELEVLFELELLLELVLVFKVCPGWMMCPEMLLISIKVL